MNDNRILRVMEDELGKARQRLKSAKADASMFGMYGDCGPEYERDHVEAKAVAEYLELLLPQLRAKIVKPKNNGTLAQR